jgi:hypothetical protein
LVLIRTLLVSLPNDLHTKGYNPKWSFCLACMNVQLQSRPCRYVSTVHTGKVQFTQNQNLTLELGLWFMSVHMLLSLVNLHLEPPHNLKHCKGKAATAHGCTSDMVPNSPFLLPISPNSCWSLSTPAGLPTSCGPPPTTLGSLLTTLAGLPTCYRPP